MFLGKPILIRTIFENDPKINLQTTSLSCKTSDSLCPNVIFSDLSTVQKEASPEPNIYSC